jgi:hypothetical protein
VSGVGVSVLDKGDFVAAIAGGLGADSILGGSGSTFGADEAILSSNFDSGLEIGSIF